MLNNLNIYNQVIKDFKVIKEQIREMAIGVYTFDELVLDQMFFRITSIEKNLYQFLEGVQID